MAYRQPGERIVRKDRYGRVIEDISSTDSQAAHNLALSIDERLQALVYRELNNAVALTRLNLVAPCWWMSTPVKCWRWLTARHTTLTI